MSARRHSKTLAKLVVATLLPLHACAYGFDESTSSEAPPPIADSPGVDEGLAGAGGSADDLSSSVDDEGEVEASGQALTGTVLPDASCLQNEINLATWSVQAARHVAVSQGFYECLTDAVSGTVSLLHDGATVSAGPYNVFGVDPHASLSRSLQATYARTAAQSQASITLRCGGSSSESGGVIAYAGIGTYDEQREASEVMTAAQGWRALAANDGGQPASSATTAQFYQSTRRRAANALWHEAMHQWGYDHAGGPWKQSFENTMPYIVGDCMERVMQRSSTCTNVCGANRRPVMRFRSSTCDCISDPQYDVGVLLPASSNGLATETCTYRGAGENRFNTDTVPTYWMDTEDDGTDDSSHSGWSSTMRASPGGKGYVYGQFCRVPGINFRRKRLASGSSSAQLLAANYGVVRLGASCPPGSVAAGRLFDNEDTDNDNHAYGLVAPHKIKKNLRLELCVFQGTTSTTNSAVDPFPVFDQDSSSAGVDAMRFGVFGGTAFPGALATGAVFSDDEDTGPTGETFGVASATVPFIEVTANGNTRMRTIHAK